MSNIFRSSEAAISRESYGFIRYSDNLTYAPLSTFGSNLPSVHKGRLVTADPVQADNVLNNSSEMKGGIALVVRGGCTFPHKARMVQQAGAVALIVANNDPENPTQAFKMGEMNPGEAEGINIPCVMLSYENIKDLLVWAHGTSHATVSVEILESREAGIAFAQEHARKARNSLTNSEQVTGEMEKGVFGHFFKTSESLLKSTVAAAAATIGSAHLSEMAAGLTGQRSSSSVGSPSKPDHAADERTGEESGERTGGRDSYHVDLEASSSSQEQPQKGLVSEGPLLAFVRWASGATSYHITFAPLADFGSPGKCHIYSGKFVFSDPPHADIFPLRNASDMAGAIVVVERGKCTFPEKIERAQKAGAIAVIVANNDENDAQAAFVMGVDSLSVEHITIPSVMISFEVRKKLLKHVPKYISIMILKSEAAAGVLGVDETDCVLQCVPKTPRIMPPLHRACSQAHQEFVDQLLVRGGVDVNEQDSRYLSPLHHAVIAQSLPIVEALLSKGASANVQDLGGQTPLHYACLRGDPKIVERLITVGSADVKLLDAGMQTALHLACIAGNADCIELLITANASVDREGRYSFHGVDAKDVDDSTPLHRACQEGNSECALYLIAANAKLDEKDRNGKAPLHHICQAINKSGKSAGALEVIEKFISLGAILDEDENHMVALDLIQNKQLRRDLEIGYLKRQSSLQRHQIHCLETEKVAFKKILADCVGEQIQMQFRVKDLTKQREEMQIELQSHSVQLQQLQIQMKTTLQFLQKMNTESESRGPYAHKVEPLSKVSLESMELSGNPTDEGTNAEEAALARDIAKKHMRAGDYQSAIIYFRKSLEIFSLPGVKKLLERAIQESEEEEKVRAAERAASRKAESKKALIARYKRLLEKGGCPPSALEAVEAEIAKLSSLEEHSTEFLLARDWLEWLTALPWCSIPADAISIDTFARVGQAKAFEELQKEETVVIRIQRCWRRHCAVRSSQESAASVIQARWKGYCTRKNLQMLLSAERKNGLLRGPKKSVASVIFIDEEILFDASDENELSAAFTPPVSREIFAQEISQQPDAYASRRLLNAILVKGILLWKTPAMKHGMLDEGEQFYVLQLLKASHLPVTEGQVHAGNPEVFADLTHAQESGTEYYIWRRWGSVQTAGECSVQGPYRFDNAVREFQKKFQQHTRNAWGEQRETFMLSPLHYKPVIFPSVTKIAEPNLPDNEESIDQRLCVVSESIAAAS